MFPWLPSGLSMAMVVVAAVVAWMYSLDPGGEKSFGICKDRAEISRFVDFALDAGSFHPSLPTSYSSSLSTPFPSNISILQALYIRLRKPLPAEIDAHRAVCEELKSIFRVDSVECIEPERLRALSEFVRSLAQIEKWGGGSVEGADRKVVVVGAGPVGLLGAIEAWRGGANVTVLEKRMDYTRDIWFDLYPPPWYDTHLTLNEFGFFYQTGDRKDWTLPGNKSAYTVRAQNLERFLAKVAVTLGISVNYGVRFLGICTKNESAFTISILTNHEFEPPVVPPATAYTLSRCDQTTREQVRMDPVDVIVGGDGSKSTVANTSGIRKRQLETFFTRRGDLERKINVPGLKQVSMVLDFKLSNGTCPKTRTDVRGTDPYYVGFLVKGIAAVFKRFYYGHCQMQLLFTREAGMEIMNGASSLGGKEANLPWNTVLRVCKVVLKKPYKSQKHLKQALLHTCSGNSICASIVPVSIDLASTTSTILRTPEPSHVSISEPRHVFSEPSHVSSSANFKAESKKRDPEPEHVSVGSGGLEPGHVSGESESGQVSEPRHVSGGSGARDGVVVLLVGDALSTAHYRLGVGINTGFRTSKAIGLALRESYKGKSKEEILVGIERIFRENVGGILEIVLDLQGSTMYYETYCGLIVFFDHSSDDLLKAQSLYARGSKLGEYNPIDDSELATLCAD